MKQLQHAPALSLLTAALLAVVSSQTQPTVSPAYTGRYLILAPNTIRPGFLFTHSATIYETVGSSSVSLISSIYKGSTLVVQSTDYLQVGTSTVNLQVPTTALPGDDYTLQLSASGGIQMSKTSPLTFNVEHFSIFVQSDKAIYKPGQTVQFRVMAVYPTLRPYVGPFSVSVIDAKGNVIQQWLDRQPNKNGIISDSIVMSDHPVMGEWTIRAEAEGQVHDYTIEIDEYVLPKFEVTVNVPTFFDLSYDQVPVSLSAKYTFGKPVEGRYTLTLSQRYSSTVIKLTGDIDGDTVIMVSRNKFKEFDRGVLYNSASFIFTANVTETLTGITQVSDPTPISHYNFPIKVEFSDSVSRSSYKPGLQYQLYLVVSRQDGGPLTEEERNGGVVVRYCENNCYQGTSNWTPESFTIAPNTGVVEAFIPTITTTTGQLQIEVEYEGRMSLARGASIPQDNSGISGVQGSRLPRGGYRTRVSKSLAPAKSYSNAHIQVRAATSSALTVGSQASFIVESTVSPGSLTYQIVSRGNIIHSEVLESVTETYTIQKEITAAMSPKSKLLVSFITDSKEVILDSLEFIVNVVFDNPISANFSRVSAEPGDNVNFEVETTPGAFVGILTIDKSVLLLADGNDITHNQVLESVGRFDTTTSGSSDYNPFANRLWCFVPYYTSGETAAEVLKNAGILYVTDGRVNNEVYMDYAWGNGIRPMFKQKMGDDGAVPEAAVPAVGDAAPGRGSTGVAEKDIRKEFPETWLWVDTEADSSGRVSVMTRFPDTITSWVGTAISMDTTAGLGVTENAAEATVFKKFFVSLNLPYSVVRGEKFVLSATVFNYQENPVTARVQLQASKSYVSLSYTTNSIEKEVNTEVTKEVTIEGNSGKTVNFPVKPMKNGMMELVVTATAGMQQDGVRRYLLVEPQGVAQEYVSSDLVDFSNSIDGTYSKTFSINLPAEGLVPDSVRASISATGDILGPTMSNLDQLLRLPTGCGEQTMIAFAPDVFVYRYLQETGQSNPAIEEKALRFMKTGYQHELTYQHADGSFSAWGDRNGDPGSTWLTAFVVRSFLQAVPYIYVDPAKVGEALAFLMDRQQRDGTFQSSGNVIHKDMEGGVSSAETLTAYVAIAMHQATTSDILSTSTKMDAQTALNNALSYLVGRYSSLQDDKYAMTIVTYALVLGGSAGATQFRTRLAQLQTSEAEGSIRYWTDQDGQETTPANDAEFFYRPWRGPPSAAIEMTGYGMLSYLAVDDVPNSVPVARWLSQQRNSIGGYSSTQDTVLALFALTSYAARLSNTDKSIDMTITTSADPAYSQAFEITNNNSIILQQFELAVVDGNVVVQGRGQGSFLLTFILHYNLEEVRSSEDFDINVVVVKEAKNSIVLNACGSYIGGGEGTGMSIMEVGIPSGFYAVEDSLSQAVTDNEFATQFELMGQKAVIYFSEIPSREICLTLEAQRSKAVAETQPSIVKIYDYYKPANQRVASYSSKTLSQTSMCSLCQDCCGDGSGGAVATSSISLLVALTIVTLFTTCLM